jgi:hypothetical protein
MAQQHPLKDLCRWSPPSDRLTANENLISPMRQNMTLAFSSDKSILQFGLFRIFFLCGVAFILLSVRKEIGI